MKPYQPTLEIGATTLEDALQAAQGGAHSLEIFENLALGGLTPPLEIVQRIRDSVNIILRVMIRLHANSFVYTAAEIETMLQQIEAVKPLGVEGVVFGALTPDGLLDIPLIGQFAQAAAPLPLTVHRALDVSRDPDTALDRLHGFIPRILTSGPAASAWAGREALGRWVQTYPDFQFANSGSITPEQIPELLRVTRVHEIHIGSAARTDGVVDAQKVGLLLQALNTAD